MSFARDLSPRRRRFAAAWAVALALGAAAVALGAHAWETQPHPTPLGELAYYPSGRHLRAASMGHGETAADLAWMRAVQYYGAHRQTDNRFDHLPHVFEVLTDLAPRFVPAYVFGAFAMAQEGGDFARAAALMDKGLAANPRSGTLAFQAGFLHYVRPGGRDLDRAAELFQQASRMPDGPPQAARFAAYARQHAGNLAVAYELWAMVARTSDNRYLREMAVRNMRRIEEAVREGRPDQAARRLSTPQVRMVPGAP